LTAAVGVFALLSAVPAFAQQNITALQSVPIEIGSSFVVTDGCIINGDDSSVTMDFGTVQNPAFLASDIFASVSAGTDPFNTFGGNGSGSIEVAYNINSITATFEIGPGQNSSNILREMTNPLAAGTPGFGINYRLYSLTERTPASEYRPDGTKLALFGNGNIIAGNPFRINVFGRIFATDANRAVAGIYTDVATGTLTF
jgi:hypothetical protein